MTNRRLHILVALALHRDCGPPRSGSAIRAAICALLDRLESTLTDLRTLARGVQAPPDLVTIVAIDDEHREARRHLSAAARGDRQDRRGDRAAGAEGHRDRSPAGRQGACGRRRGAGEIARGASDRAGGGGGLSERRAAVRAGATDRSAGLPTADRFLLPLPAFADRAEVGIANVTTGQTGTPLSVPMLFRTRDKIELSFPLRVASVAIGKPLTIEPDRLLFGDRSIATASDYALPISYYGPRRTIRTVSAASLIDGQVDREAIAGPHRRPRRDRDRRRRFLSDAVRFTDAGGGNHFHRDHASGRRRRRRARPAGSHRRGRHDDPASDAAGRSAGLAAKRGRPPRGHRGDPGMGGGKRDRLRARHMARRRDDDRRSRAARHPVRRRATMVGPAKRAASRRAKQAARTIPDAGPAGMADAAIPTSC